MCTLLYTSKWHQDVPDQAHSEELGEGMLSKLVRDRAKNTVCGAHYLILQFGPGGKYVGVQSVPKNPVQDGGTTRRSRGLPGRSCQRTCPLWWALLVVERRGDRSGLAQPRSACVAGRRAGHQMGSLGNASHTMAYGGVDLVLSYTGLVGRGRAGAYSAPSTNIVIPPTPRSSSGECRRWSAASSSDNPPGYVARARFRYGAVSQG